MKQTVSLLLVFCAALAVSNIVQGVPEKEGGDPTAGATYIGAKACKKCHFKQHKTWKKMKHAKAWESLPAKFQNMTEKDPEGRLCISCHVTGFGEKDRGGFDTIEASQHLLGVQCESCHGPGSKHKEAGQKVKDDKRKKFNADEPTFMNNQPTTCYGCHNPHISHAKYKEGG